MSLFQSGVVSSGSLAFPEPLAERYRPRRIAEFIGLEKPRKVLSAFDVRDALMNLEISILGA